MAGIDDDGRSGGGGFLMGLVIGTTVGAALAMILAPKAGWESRRDLVAGANDLGQAAKDAWVDVTETAGTAFDKGRAAYNETLKKVADSASTWDHQVRDVVKDAVKEAGSSARSSVKEFTETRY